MKKFLWCLLFLIAWAVLDVMFGGYTVGEAAQRFVSAGMTMLWYWIAFDNRNRLVSA